jgi:hypothetical protein
MCFESKQRRKRGGGRNKEGEGGENDENLKGALEQLATDNTFYPAPPPRPH